MLQHHPTPAHSNADNPALHAGQRRRRRRRPTHCAATEGLTEYPDLDPRDKLHTVERKMYRGGRLLDDDVVDDIVDGMMSNKIVYEDMDYWFKSWPGEFERTGLDDVAEGVSTGEMIPAEQADVPYVTGVDFTAPIGAVRCVHTVSTCADCELEGVSAPWL